MALDKRITEEELTYHKAVLQKYKIDVPEDIETRIRAA